MNNIYKEQVRLLLRVLPIIVKEEDFAIHGGTAINLFMKDLPRYSVDIDLTYIPLKNREQSLLSINEKLNFLKEKIMRAIPLVKITSVPNKLLCRQGNCTVKIEVNGIKRGVIGDVITVPLCKKAQEEFKMFCKVRVVPISQLYGGKIAAALSRQHPRDLFDYKYMDMAFEEIKAGLIFNILSSDKPIIESLQPNKIEQKQALENQFQGMTEIPFSYEDYEKTREDLIQFVNSNLSVEDKKLLLSFEVGNPLWENSEYAYFKDYPSVQWKLLNIRKLNKTNPKKYQDSCEKLRVYLKI